VNRELTPKPLHWGSVLLASAAVHLAVLAALQFDNSGAGVSIADGIEGLEIGLGFAADLNSESAESTTDLKAEPQPPANVPPAPKPAVTQAVSPQIETVDFRDAPAIVAADNESESAREQDAMTAPQPEHSLPPTPDSGDMKNQPSAMATHATAGRSNTDPSQTEMPTATRGEPGLSALHSGSKAGNAKVYFREIMAWLAQHKTYPVELKKAKQEGVVVLKFTINKRGDLLQSTVEKSSGVPAIDQAALNMLRSASPLPGLPRFIDKDQITLVIPIEYSLITNAFNKE
jgi:periplasmic protein TonB